MAKVPRAIPVSDLRRDAAGVLKELKASGLPFFITRHGRTAAILLSIDAYERFDRQRDLLRLIAIGEREIATGKGDSLESVLEEADVILEGDGS